MARQLLFAVRRVPALILLASLLAGIAVPARVEARRQGFSCGDQSQIPGAECAALVALYSSTGGDAWTDHTGWLDSLTPCSWFGMTCETGSGGGLQVKGVELPDNQLEGTLPAALGDLAWLDTLDLSGNALSGPIPSALGSAARLAWLDLADNALSGSIPASFSGLTHLTGLRLHNNQLGGALPDLGAATGLTTLRLENNRLVGAIPAGVTSLTNLSNTATNVGYNGLWAPSAAVATFLDGKDPDWAATQTLPPADFHALPGSVTQTGALVAWTPIPYTGDSGGYEVGFSTTPGGPYETACTIADKLAAGCTVNWLDLGVTYYLVIFTTTYPHGAQQNDVISALSPEIAIHTPGAIPPSGCYPFGSASVVVCFAG